MKIFLVFLLSLGSMCLSAQSCIGKWVTNDDNTGEKKSVVKLYKNGSELYGKIIYLFPDDDLKENATCTKCTDDRKNQPLKGLQVVRKLKWDGKSWKGGTIVDPENGKIYTVSIWINPLNKDVLMVRGYIGPFYRTQSWLRLPKD